MSYESHSIRRPKIRYNSLNLDAPIVHQLVIAGAKTTPTSATIAVYSPDDQSTPILAAVSMTVAGTLLTKSLDTTTVATWPVNTGYRAQIVTTYGMALTKTDEIIFDVVPFLLELGVSYDQLIARDDRLRGMTHAGDDDFSELIESCRDEIQLLLETKAIDERQMLENMIIDRTKMAVPFRFYLLAAIFETKGMEKEAEKYKKEFEKFFRIVLAGAKFDKDMDGAEDGKQAAMPMVRFTT